MTAETANRQNSVHKIFRWLLLFTILTHSAGLLQLSISAYRNGFLPGSTKWMVLVSANAGIILVEGIILLLSQSALNTLILKPTRWLCALFSNLRWLNLFFSLVTIAAFTYLVLSPIGHFIPNPFTRFLLFWMVVCASCFFMKAWSQRSILVSDLRWLHCLGISLLFVSALFLGFSFFQDISDYPFTLTWSETSRYYYASLFFSERIYGLETQPTVLHPSRYLLQAIPFLIQNSSLWLHRTWQVFLWLAITLLTSFLLIKRARIGKEAKLWAVLAIAWAFVYLLIGPVYYHLQITLILVLWGFNNRSENISPSWQLAINILVVGIASAWAGISRVNWFPVPGLLAAALLFIEQPVGKPNPGASGAEPRSSRFLTWSSLIYGLKGVTWTIFGTLIAFSAQYIYIRWSGNASESFTSSFSSDLLWYRLWPSSTYVFGILPGAILVSLPLLMMIWGKLNSKHKRMPYWKSVHPIRLLGLATILLVLFFGGLVVSVKIGGGSNLHNMDAYLSILLVMTILIVFDQLSPNQVLHSPTGFQEDNPGSPTAKHLPKAFLPLTTPFQITTLVLSLVIPITLTLFSCGPSSALPVQKEIDRSLKVIKQAIRQMDPGKNEALFLSNRHLLTFGYIEGVELIPEYERVYLMEMAMSGNREYLDRFHKDLADQRFGIIITEPIFITEKGGDVRFGEENNAWVKEVSEYILCYYKPRSILWSVGIQIFIPRDNPHRCK